MELGIINWSLDKGNKIPTTNAKLNGKQTRVVQLREMKVMDILHDDW